MVGQREPYRGETYYGRPAIKPSHYGWPIAAYLFAGGLAGAAQLIATIADLVGHTQDRAVVRAGRYVALGGALVSPVLLIADLHTPQRWYNMLRIFRRTSPMSIGSWTLFTFGTLSGATAVFQALEDLSGLRLLRWVQRLFGLPATAAGVVMSIYTGTLLVATSNPLWAAAREFMSPLFGATATTTATAALSLILDLAGASRGTLRRLQRLAVIAGGAQLVLAAMTDYRLRRQRVSGPLEEQPVAFAYRFGALGLGMIAPLIANAAQVLAGRRSRAVSLVAAGAMLVGGFVERAVFVFAGNVSARHPRDYFQFTQPEE